MGITALGQKILASRGLEIKYQSRPIYADQATIGHAMSLVKGYTMLSRSTLISLADQVAYCNQAGLGGAFVECGLERRCGRPNGVYFQAYQARESAAPFI